MPATVSTGEAARELGISARSLARWAHDGQITPEMTTPGGHHRWNMDSLREQLRALRKREE